MKKIREHLSLSQQDLALLLNVSCSTIAMYECGMRSLPSKATEKWCRLQALWHQSQMRAIPAVAAANVHNRLQQQRALSLLNDRVKRAAIRKIGLTMRLSRMETQHRNYGLKLYVLRNLMEEALPGSRELQLLKNREQMTLIRLAGCCSSRRQLLTFQLQVLTSEQKAAQAGTVILQHQT